jgi:predicted dehydrogenase
MSQALRVSLIGLGRQTTENYIPAIAQSRNLVLDSVCDLDDATASQVGNELGVPFFGQVETLLAERNPDFAVVCVPHSAYVPIIAALAEKGVHILKEKPFARNIDEACEIHKLIERAGIILTVTLVRRFHPIYTMFPRLRKRIGNIHTIEGRYTLNIPRLDDGWRSSHSLAGGGAILDMGYHAIDLLVWYFGLPERVAARIGTRAREGQKYDVEDTAMVFFAYEEQNDAGPIMGNLLLSRAFPQKDERLLIVGSKGAVELKRGEIIRIDNDGGEVENLSRKGTWLSAAIDQLENFADTIASTKNRRYRPYFDHFAHMAFIEAAYLSHQRGSFVSPKDLLPRFVSEHAS